MRTLTLALLATLVMGCAPSHKVTLEEMQTAQTCHFWMRGIATSWGTVENGQARLNGGFAPKQPLVFTSPTEIDMPGAWVKHPVGSYENHTLNVWSSINVPITEHQSVVPGMFAGMKVEYNDRCSDRDAALGVALMVMVAVASSH